MTFTATQDAGQITVEGAWVDTFPASEALRRLDLYDRKAEDGLPNYEQAASALVGAIQAADALRAAMGEAA